MAAITIKGLNIGVGSPKIIVSIVEKTQGDIIKKANRLLDMKIDVVEWRIDFYEDVFKISCVLDTLNKLRDTIGDIPILFTFRTTKEGGDREISMEEYSILNREVANSGYVDLVDVEMFSGNDIVKEIIAHVHEAGVMVVGSNHDFFTTPEKDEIVSRLRKMQDMGADILKIAVMSNSPKDVIKLLDATNEMYNQYANRPLITISMGPMGVISRLSGEVFGSAMTFGSDLQESAPGQIPVEDLVRILGIIHKYK